MAIDEPESEGVVVIGGATSTAGCGAVVVVTGDQTEAVTPNTSAATPAGSMVPCSTTPACSSLLRSLGGRWRHQPADAGHELRTRPESDTWSAIEYAAHSRDVLHDSRLRREGGVDTRRADVSEITDGQLDAAASTYADADPHSVVDAIAVAAERLAQVADDAGFEAWSRGITVGATRSDVRRLLEHALHDSEHHLGDVDHGLARLRTT